MREMVNMYKRRKKSKNDRRGRSNVTRTMGIGQSNAGKEEGGGA